MNEAMKKTLFLLATAVLSTAVSCQKINENQPKDEGVRVTVIAGTDTRTSIVDGGTSASIFKWTGTTASQITLFENDIKGTSPAIELSDSDTKAAISATFSKEADQYVYKAIITSSLAASGNALLPNTQNPTTTSFDPTADILIGKPTDAVAERPASVSMLFGRAVAVNKMILTNFKGTDEKVKEIVFTAENNIAGYVTPHYELGYASYVEGGAFKKITLNYGQEGESLTESAFNAYFLSWPVNTGSFGVKVTTDQYVYTKEIATGSVTFKLDKLVAFNFSLSDATAEPVVASKTFSLVTSADDLIIGSEVMILNAAGTYAMSSTQNSNNRGQQAVTVSENKVNSVSGCEIFTLGNGTVDNTYSFYATQSATKGYIYAASSTANQLKTQETNDANSSFAITIDGTSYAASVVAQGTNSRNKLQYNGSLFSCYSTTQTAVKIYQYDDGKTPLDKPVITLAPDASAKSVTVSWEAVTNADNYKITCTGKDDISTDETSCSFTGLEYDTEYTIKVTAKGSDQYRESSASKTLTIKDPASTLSTMDAIYTKATDAGSTAVEVAIQFNNWVISGVSGNSAYLTDGNGKGMIIYKNGHGFTAGDILSGTVNCHLMLYQSAAEVTDVTSSSTGLTVTSGGSVTPQSATIDQLSGINTGACFIISNITCGTSSSSYYSFSDGTNSISVYKGILSSLPALTTGVKYNVTGVFQTNSSVNRIYPRSNDDIQEVAATKYGINIPAVEHGSVSTSPATEAAEGTVVTLTVTPEDGYRLAQLTVTTASSQSVAVSNNKFTMPAEAVTVSATFEEIPTHTITIADTENGTVTTDPASSAEEGETVTIITTPDDGYKVKSITVTKNTSGTEVTVSDNKFTMPEEDVTVAVVFEEGSSTYACIFTSKSWATGTGEIKWTSGKDGGQLTSNQGIQVTTTYTGANATTTSPYTNVSKIIVKYCTNASNGVGTIKVQIGTGTEQSFSVTKPSSGGKTIKEAVFTFSPNETGKVKVTAECTTNSVYINGVTIYAQ